MYKSIVIIIISLWLTSCKNNSEKTVEYSIASLTINFPHAMEFIQKNGIDSHVVEIINKEDTFYVQYGKKGIIDNLFPGSVTVLSIREKDLLKENFGREPSDDQVKFSEYPEEDRQQNIFDAHYYRYDTINGLVVKLVLPKVIGEGKTGLFIPSLPDGNSFSMYANNLDSSTQRIALDIFQTIKYKPKK